MADNVHSAIAGDVGHHLDAFAVPGREPQKTQVR
jgi:hypothetical protein